jgi:hypothetical protein
MLMKAAREINGESRSRARFSPTTTQISAVATNEDLPLKLTGVTRSSAAGARTKDRKQKALIPGRLESFVLWYFHIF